MMRFIKRDKKDSVRKLAHSNSTSSSSFVSKTNMFARKKPRSDLGSTATGSTGDESSSSAVEVTEEAWHVENFQDGPPQDEDWWSDNVEDSLAVETHSEQQKIGKRELESYCPKRFRNRGFETWEKTRQAWIKMEADVSTGSTVRESGQKTLSKYQRRELHRNLTNERQFVLPTSMALKDLIEVYTENIWSSGKGKS